jgi:hypothetical protein
MNFPRRIVGDYDVDRLQVEVQQCIEPRSTNHPFGLIPVFGIGSDQERRKKRKKAGQIGKTSIWMPGSGRRAQARNVEC